MVLHGDQPEVPRVRDRRRSPRVTASTPPRRSRTRTTPSRCSCCAADPRVGPSRAAPGRRSAGSTEARARTLELVAPLDEAQLTRQHSPLMSPIVWDLGHIANFEEQWVRRAHAPRDRRDDDDAPARSTLRRRSRIPRATRAACRCSSARGVPRATSTRSAGTRCDVLARSALPDRRSAARRRLRPRDARAARGAAQRDDPADDPARSTISSTSRRGAASRAARSSPLDDAAEAVVPAGAVRHGHRRPRLAYDNERPAHEVDVPRASAIDVAPVTNGAVPRASCDDGGYRRRELWSDDGLALAARESGAAHPGAVAPATRRHVARARLRPPRCRSRSTSR